MNAQMAKRFNKLQKQNNALQKNVTELNHMIYALSALVVDIVNESGVELRDANSTEFVRHWKIINGDKKIISGRFDDDKDGD